MDDDLPPPIPATYTDARRAMQEARTELWAAHQEMRMASSTSLAEWSEGRFQAAVAKYVACLTDCAMSGFDEVAAAWKEQAEAWRARTEYAKETEKILRQQNARALWVSGGMLLATIVYAVAAIWQATHPAVVPVVVPLPVPSAALSAPKLKWHDNVRPTQ